MSDSVGYISYKSPRTVVAETVRPVVRSPRMKGENVYSFRLTQLAAFA